MLVNMANKSLRQRLSSDGVYNCHSVDQICNLSIYHGPNARCITQHQITKTGIYAVHAKSHGIWSMDYLI